MNTLLLFVVLGCTIFYSEDVLIQVEIMQTNLKIVFFSTYIHSYKTIVVCAHFAHLSIKCDLLKGKPAIIIYNKKNKQFCKQFHINKWLLQHNIYFLLACFIIVCSYMHIVQFGNLTSLERSNNSVCL